MRKSKWSQGVDEYADELRENLRENRLAPTEKNMLNGASNWKQYSWGGNSLIYDKDIANRLATPSEIKRKTSRKWFGEVLNNPNKDEQWLDTQARALYQASRKVIESSRHNVAPHANHYHQTAIAKDINNVRKKRG